MRIEATRKQRGTLVYVLNSQSSCAASKSWAEAEKKAQAMDELSKDFVMPLSGTEENSIEQSCFEVTSEGARTLLSMLEPLRNAGKISLTGYQPLMPIIRQLQEAAGDTE